jgi:hypothetical protein
MKTTMASTTLRRPSVQTIARERAAAPHTKRGAFRSQRNATRLPVMLCCAVCVHACDGWVRAACACLHAFASELVAVPSSLFKH